MIPPGLKTFEYGIGDMAALQKVARQKMYSDPQAAIVREYLSNCIDAQRKRASTYPDSGFAHSTSLITIKYEDGQISFIDRGVGISQRGMVENFASYYGSSKRDSNDEIGGFGLGCKTAFSDPNRDSFTVDTVYQDDSGIRWRYITYHYVNERGLTAFAEVSHTETTDDLGTAIILPIQEDDLQTFANNLRRVCQYWPEKPTVIGLHEFDELSNERSDGEVGFVWSERKPVASGDGWEVDEATVGIDIVIDSIPYRLEAWRVGLSDDSVSLSLFFKTGEIPVTSTRETLDYGSEETARLIKDRIRSITENAVEELSKKFEEGLDWKTSRLLIKTMVNVFKTDQSSVVRVSHGAVTLSWLLSVSEGRSVYTNASVWEVQRGGSFRFRHTDSVDLGLNGDSERTTFLITTAKRPNRERIESWIESNPERGGRVYVIRCPVARPIKKVSSKDALDYLTTAHKELLLEHTVFKSDAPEKVTNGCIILPFDLAYWPTMRKKPSAVRKKLTTAASWRNGGWKRLEEHELQSLLPKRCYYLRSYHKKTIRPDSALKAGVLSSNDKLLSAPVGNLVKKVAKDMRNPLVVVLNDDPVPPHWTDLQEFMLRIVVQRREKVMKRLPDKIPVRLMNHGFKPVHSNLFHPMVRKQIRELTTRTDAVTAVTSLDLGSIFPVLSLGRYPKGVFLRVLKQFRGEGSLKDQKACSLLLKRVKEISSKERAEVIAFLNRDVAAVRNWIKASKAERAKSRQKH